MRVAVRADQRGHADAVAADLPDEIAEDREARDHRQLFLREHTERRGDCGKPKGEASDEGATGGHGRLQVM